MARDPIQHDPQLLRDGLRRINGGEQLDDTSTVRKELIHLALVNVTHDGELVITREGRTFLDSEG